MVLITGSLVNKKVPGASTPIFLNEHLRTYSNPISYLGTPVNMTNSKESIISLDWKQHSSKVSEKKGPVVKTGNTGIHFHYLSIIWNYLFPQSPCYLLLGIYFDLKHFFFSFYLVKPNSHYSATLTPILSPEKKLTVRWT